MSARLGLFKRLTRERSGTAMTEFALSLPLLLTAGMWGTELVNFTVTQMKVNEIATHLADNASRIGDTSTLMNRKIFEADINDLFMGSNIQASRTLNFYEHGRAVVSSLEIRNVNTMQEYIHWQRCKGKKTFSSAYGSENQNVSGMGPAGEEVHAEVDQGVIFVEVAYDYQPLVSSRFIGSTTIKSHASFIVRDKRDYTQIHQRNPGQPDPIARCNKNDGYTAVVY